MSDEDSRSTFVVGVAEPVLIHEWTFDNASTNGVIQVVEAQLGVLDARAYYDEKLESQQYMTSTMLAASEETNASPKGCALASTYRGFVSFYLASVSSTICVTDHGRYIEVALLGDWDDPDDDSGYLILSGASIALVEHLLAQWP